MPLRGPCLCGDPASRSAAGVSVWTVSQHSASVTLRDLSVRNGGFAPWGDAEHNADGWDYL